MTDVIEGMAFEEPGQELAVVQESVSLMPRIAQTPEQIKADLERIYEVTKDFMRAGTDYMEIAGRKSLTQPGAERLMRFFGMGAQIEITDKTERWPEGDDPGYVSYTYKCKVGPITPNGIVVVGECEGCCNSRESKYKRVSAYDIANTVMKMAAKRAFTGAVRRATGTSEFWSDDLEDLPKELLSDRKPTSSSAPQAQSTEPADFIMPWGKHEGESLGQIKTSDAGYLTWLAGSLGGKKQKGELDERHEPLLAAVERMV